MGDEKVEEKKPRTAQEINNDYAQTCAKLGDMVAKRKNLDTQGELLLKQLEAINVEMLESNAYYAKQAAKPN